MAPHFSLYDFGVGNAYSNIKVQKIGYDLNNKNGVFIFEDGTALEFNFSDVLDLNNLFDS